MSSGEHLLLAANLRFVGVFLLKFNVEISHSDRVCGKTEMQVFTHTYPV